MIEQSTKEYDLILRIRPDLLVEGNAPLALTELCQRSKEDCLIYANFQPIISSGIVSWQIGQCIPMMIGDLFAVGSPDVMKKYGSVYSDNLHSMQSGTYGIPKGFVAHTSIALLLMRYGVFVEKVPSLQMVDFCESSPVSGQSIREALLRDIASRPPGKFDSVLLSATVN